MRIQAYKLPRKIAVTIACSSPAILYVAEDGHALQRIKSLSGQQPSCYARAENRRSNTIWCCRNFPHTDSDRIVKRVQNGWCSRNHSLLANSLCAEGADW